MNAKPYMQIAKSFFGNKLTYVVFFISSFCNARCKFCFYWKNIEEHDKKTELTMDEIQKISEKFPDFTYLTISGGEPFLRPDLPEIVKTFVENNNVQFVAIPTNGLLPQVIKKQFTKMLNYCPDTSFRLTLPLDGLFHDHDEVRGVRGNFERYVETYLTLDEMRKEFHNFNVDTNTTVSGYNQDKAKEIVTYIKDNFAFDNQVLNLARGSTKDEKAKEVIIKKYEECVNLIEDIAVNKDDRRKGLKLKLLKTIKLVMRDIILQHVKEGKAAIQCSAAKHMVVLNEKGDVFPCEILGEEHKLGNLRDYDYDINKILASEKAENERRFIKDTKCHCTYECAIQNSLLYNPKIYPAIAKKFIQLRH